MMVGEPGCGEHAVAQLLHQSSPLSARPFLRLSASEALSLFQQDHSEHDLASAGMFYVSRPDRLPRVAQAGLLRMVHRFGPQAPRIVAFAERGLRPLVSADGFSAELADCLGALRIVIPPLRDRREDITQLLSNLVQHLAAQSAALLPQLAEDLLDAARVLPWEGNLPQLYAAAEGLVERARQGVLHAIDLDAVLGSMTPPATVARREVRMLRLDDVIQEHIRAVLLACNGNKLRTSEILGISRSTLYRMLEIPAQQSSQTFNAPDLRMTG
jgi:DNA-binding NtrC family response regulator